MHVTEEYSSQALRSNLCILLLIISALLSGGQQICFAASESSIHWGGETVYYFGTSTHPGVSVSPVPVDFGTVLVGNTPTQSVTVTNNGDGGLTIGTVTHPSAPFTETADSCSGQTLPKNGYCTITIQFAPASAASFSASFVIPSNDANSPSFAVPLLGTGTSTAAVLSVTPNPLDFGTIPIDTTATVIVTLQNTGNAGLTLSSYGSLGLPFFRVAGCPVGSNLTPSQACSLIMRFAPTSANSFTDTLAINSTAMNSTVALNLKGVATVAPVISISPNPDNFGNVPVGNSKNTTITVSNTGSSDLILGSPALTTPTEPYNITSTTCTSGLSVPPGANCTINVAFAPASAGSSSGGFSVYSNSGGASNTQTPITLSAQATSAPPPTCSLSFNPTSIAPGDSSTLSWASTNDADAQLPYVCTGNIGSGVLTGGSGMAMVSPTESQTCSAVADNGQGGTIACNATIIVTTVPAPTCTFAFSPSNITTGQSTTASWTSKNDADGQIPYNCNGNLGSGVFNGASGSATVTPESSQLCTITSDNGVGATKTCSATVTVASAPPPACTLSFNPSSIAAGQSTTASWTSSNDADGLLPYTCTGDIPNGTFTAANGSAAFSPLSTQICTISLDNGYGGTNTCSATVTVTACSQISLSATTLDCGVIPAGSSTKQLLTINNTGVGPLTLTSFTAPSAPFSILNDGTCTNGLVLQSGGSCTVDIQARPATGGSFTGSLSITHNSQCADQSSVVQLTAQSLSVGDTTQRNGVYILFVPNLIGVNQSNIWNTIWADAWSSPQWLGALNNRGAPYLIGNVGGPSVTLFVRNADQNYVKQPPLCAGGATYSTGSYSVGSDSLINNCPANYSITLPSNSACIILGYHDDGCWCNVEAGVGSFETYGIWIDTGNGIPAGKFTMPAGMWIQSDASPTGQFACDTYPPGPDIPACCSGQIPPGAPGGPPGGPW